MALVPTITKVSAIEPQAGRGMHTVTLKLSCMDGVDEVINQNFSEPKKDHVAMSMVQERFRVRMQEVIDRYKREQELLGSTELDNAVPALQASLVTKE